MSSWPYIQNKIRTSPRRVGGSESRLFRFTSPAGPVAGLHTPGAWMNPNRHQALHIDPSGEAGPISSQSPTQHQPPGQHPTSLGAKKQLETKSLGACIQKTETKKKRDGTAPGQRNRQRSIRDLGGLDAKKSYNN